MAKKILTDLDLNKNELQNAVVQCLATAPATGVIGQIYYNTTDHLLYQHNGTSWIAVGDISGAVVTMTENNGSGDTLKSYTISQGGSAVGTINIPKDYLVKSGTVETVSTANQPYAGAVVGDKYLDFVVNTKDTAAGSGTATHIYIPVNDLVDAYTAGNGITISSANVVSVKIDSSNANGLSLSANGLALSTATQSSAGAMSAADKTALDTLAADAANVCRKYSVTNPVLTPTGGVCRWSISKSSFGSNDPAKALCSVRDSAGDEVVADIRYESNNIVVSINSTSNIPASTYAAVIIA